MGERLIMRDDIVLHRSAMSQHYPAGTLSHGYIVRPRY